MDDLELSSRFETSPNKKNQFGIRTLLFLLTLTAFSLVIAEHLSKHSDETFAVSLIVALVLTAVGVTVSGLSVIFAFCIFITEENENIKSQNLKQCFQMLIFGVLALGPIGLLVVLAMFS